MRLLPKFVTGGAKEVPVTRALSTAFTRPAGGARTVGQPLMGLPMSLGAARPKPARAPITSVAAGSSIDVIPSLHEYLRRETVGNWLMPYMSAITPTYIEAVLRGGLSGNHTQMYQLFDLMWDTSPELQACMGEYTDGVAAKKVVFEPYRDEGEEPSKKALEKCRLVAAAFNAMRPDPAADECDLMGTVKDLLSARVHGQVVMEIDWYDTYGDGSLYIKNIPGLDTVRCPRATYWVNPVCYGYDTAYRLKLLMSPDNLKRATGDIKRGKQNPSGLTQSSYYSAVLEQPAQNQFVDFPPNKFLIGVNKGKTGSALAASVLRPLAWWWCAANFCGDYLLKAAELFGVPFRKATFDTSVTDPQKAEIRQMLQAVGSQGWALLPKGAELEFMNAMNTGSQSPQAFLFHLVESQIRKVVLHQTMTGGAHDSMGKGGGKAFGVEEGEVKDECIDQGASYACAIINKQFTPAVLVQNYGKDGDVEAPTMKLVKNAVGGLIDAQTYTALAAIIDVPVSKIRRVFDIPDLSKDDKIAGVDEGIGAEQMKQQQAMAQQQMQQQQEMADQQQQNEPGAGNSDAQDGQAAQDKQDKAANSDAEEAKRAVMTTELHAIQAAQSMTVRKRLLRKFVSDHSDFPGLGEFISNAKQPRKKQ